MSRPRLLDLFCGAGGAAAGYAAAGFDVVGVDHYPQPHYPFEWRQADALEYLEAGGWLGFDAIHASPPCQSYSTATKNLWDRADQHPDLIAPLRERLLNIGLPYVIENVRGAPLRASLMLCGTMFDATNIRKHRYFEANWPLPLAPYGCGDHRAVYDPWNGAAGQRSAIQHRAAQGITWIPEGGGTSRRNAKLYGADLFEAIPPAYTEYVGRYLLEQLP